MILMKHIETIVPSAESMDGRELIKCFGCGREFYLPKECIGKNERIKKGYEIDGLFLSEERTLYCSKDCIRIIGDFRTEIFKNL